MTRQEISKFLMLIKAAYPHRFTINQMTPHVWGKAFQQICYQDAEKAVFELIDIVEHPPSIKQIKERISQGNHDSFSLWLRLQKYLAHGARGEVHVRETAPPHVVEAIDLIGWDRLSRMPEADAEKQFLRVIQHTLKNPDTVKSLSQQSAQQLTGGETWDK